MRNFARQHTWGLLGAFVGAAILGFACSDPVPKVYPDGALPDGTKISRADVLLAFASCVNTEADEFVARAVDLEAASTAYAATPNDDTQASAAAAWRAAMKTWQRLEAMQIGPLASSGHPGAGNIAEEIYSWPLGGRCGVEQILVDKGYESSTFTTNLSTTRGLFAAEYLLFYTGTDNACAATAPMNAGGAWTAVLPELRARKAGYAAAVAKDIALRARALRDAWAPSSGNFTGKFANAGKDKSVYSTQQMAFNSASDAIFFLDYTVKDLKVGKPAGVLNCPSPACPDDVESPYAGASKEHLRNNLNGVRRLLFGCSDAGEGVGFDELLRGVGAENVAVGLRGELDAAFAALEAVPSEDLRIALSTDPASVKRLYDALKAISTRMKTEFISVLDLELPRRAEGDND